MPSSLQCSPRRGKRVSSSWTLVLMFLAMPCALHAQFSYTTNNGAITITGYTGPGGAVTIPSMIDGLPVTSIGDSAFAGTGLTNVTIPNSVTSIEDFAFDGCFGLTNVMIHNGVTNIGAAAFHSCINLINLIIPDSVTSIGDTAFGGCATLSAVTIPDSVTDLGVSAFASCSGLTNITISRNIGSIKDGAFADCHNLTTVTIPNSVTNIGNSAFGECLSLTNVTLGLSVTSIGSYAFESCGLTSITIPSSVTSIGAEAFNLCGDLEAITVDPFSSAYISVAGVLFDKSQTTLIEYPEGRARRDYTIPATVTSIGPGAFYLCLSLTNVTIGASVTNIGDSAFNGCMNLINESVGDNVTTIGGYAFQYCAGLTSVVLPSSVILIGDNAFQYCTGLKAAYFKGDAPSLGSSAFSGDSATVYYLPGTSGWGSTFGGLPTSLWALPYPLILNTSASFGQQSNKFGFTVSWATNLSVVVERTMNLANPVWEPLQTNTLTGGSFFFSDPQWTNYPVRFYRIRSP